MGRSLALIVTFVLGMFARPVAGGVAHAQGHSLEAAEPGDEVANTERRPNVAQRFERPGTVSDPDTSCIDCDGLAHPAQRWSDGGAVDGSAMPSGDVLAPSSALGTGARSRGPPVRDR